MSGDRKPIHFDRSTRESMFGRLRSGDAEEKETAWQEFVDLYGPAIRSFARRLGVSAADAEDVLQDVLIAFFSASSQFRYDPAKGRFRGYLKTSTLNAIKRRWAIKAGQPDLAASPELLKPAVDDALDQRWERDWRAAVLRRAMAEVGARYAGSPTLQAFEKSAKGQDPEAIAAELGFRSRNNVYQAKRRITRELEAVVARIRAEEG